MNIKKITGFLMAALLLSSFTLFEQKRDINIVFIGDSITYGAGLPDRATQAPPAICANYLKTQANIGAVEFSNQGHSGYTTLDWLPGTRALNDAEAAAKVFANQQAQLLFAIKIGTNDSAVKGTHGAPVSVEDYRTNLKIIIDRLLKDFPGCKIVIQHPIWYSPNTYNGSMYLQEGLTRLQTYIPVIDELVKTYKTGNPEQVFVGDTKGFKYFEKNYLTDFQPEDGHQGIFYLHPNPKGAIALGEFWGKAIARVVK
ncbi:GDSL-type esterase/lipase family protein [Mucilaginibacter sp. UR6-11]|uniref:SGNH/GDSL hydrolase family protein n=1 Tax=Mucilaginibacter sp. UR6-11 TaxID=1435644 RepID=UPI001E3BD7AE|nr:GDSL-type esterase/lipase family protein [Mucilaginibacter sp. UR6-11]MCC8424834.1 GDSL-type esterase/lipase family protein [Mucilaginibacter sp. UR6-11]